MNMTLDFYKNDNNQMKQWRENSLQSFMQKGFPTRHQEEWKYTSLHRVAQQQFALMSTLKNIDRQAIEKYLLMDFQHIVFVDGYFCPEFSTLNDKIIQLQDLATALADDANDIISKIDLAERVNLTELNNAFMQNGVVLKINDTPSKPIQILFVVSEQQANSAQYLRNLITLDEGVSAEIVEHHIHLNQQEACLTSALDQIFLAEKSSLILTKIFERNFKNINLVNTLVNQQADSKFIANNFLFGGSLVRNDYNCKLLGEHSSCTLRGLYYGNAKNHFDQHLTIDHQAAKCLSEQFYKGILTDEARAVFNGKVIVAKDAQKTDAKQNNKNLLLSRQAEIDTKPELEIYANDVKCAHGATVGQLSDEALFYLLARGIDEKDAKEILTYAFGEELVTLVQQSTLRAYISKRFVEIINC